MADFTTWSAFKTALLNDINNRAKGLKSYRAPDGTSGEYRSVDEMKQLYAWAMAMEANASATSGTPTRRVHTGIQGANW